MGDRSAPGSRDLFFEVIDGVLASLPSDLRGAALANLEIAVEDEPPDGQSILGQYRGIPLTRRRHTGFESWEMLPDRISIFSGPITRLAGGDVHRLRQEIKRVLLNEMAKLFGIDDKRLSELNRD